MFSGIVEGKGKVLKIKDHGDYLNIEISPPSKFNKGLKKGASISVNGVCLTSKDNGSKTLKFDVITETLKRTSLKNIQKGDVANLERSIKASSEIGGHLMSGHIHYTGKITYIEEKQSTKDMKISLSKKYEEYVMEKGYIGINGCSLTVGKVNKKDFYIHLIPETLKVTNLEGLVKGSEINIEIDQSTIAIVDTVKRTLARKKSR
ncbi:MAG: riboflavin synthase subunit alpha [Gammaproteobacteria bacterium]|nr:riboflavin synthase subunit alpha [Gammaproteobacteria bacterium]